MRRAGSLVIELDDTVRGIHHFFISRAAPHDIGVCRGRRRRPPRSVSSVPTTIIEMITADTVQHCLGTV